MVAFSKSRRLGNLGEDIACTFLVSKGFAILERNHLRPWGEIDIVARFNDVYRFVEVKTISREKGSRETRVNMTAEDHIHPAKMQKIARTVEVYMTSIKDDLDFQIDVVTVELDTLTRRARCKLYEQVL